MEYDLVFLGGGPAGYGGAIYAGKKGLKVAVIEKHKLGGTCLQWGCIPTKTLIHSVKLLKQIKSSSKMGITVKNVDVDIKGVLKNKDRVVDKLTKGIELLFKQNQVEVINGTGKIISPNTLLLDGKQEIKTKNTVIATGSQPADLPFLKFDGQLIIDSTTALEIPDIPPRLLVIGAGAVGLEMGIIYNYLGSEVIVVEILDQIIPGSDREVSDILKAELKKQKIDIYTSTAASNPVIDKKQNTITFHFKQDEKEWEETFNKVLLSVGRVPLSEDLFDSSLGIQTDEKGFIVVDQNHQTSTPRIFACGDVIGPPLLAHKATHQSLAIVDFIVDGKPVIHTPVPGAVFTFPEFASIGFTESEAREQGIKIKIGKFPYAAGSRSNTIDEKNGMVKVITDEKSRLIGAHIVGAEASELMPVLNLAVTRKMNVDEFRELIFIHPTLSENIWEAVASITNLSIHI